MTMNETTTDDEPESKAGDVSRVSNERESTEDVILMKRGLTNRLFPSTSPDKSPDESPAAETNLLIEVKEEQTPPVSGSGQSCNDGNDGDDESNVSIDHEETVSIDHSASSWRDCCCCRRRKGDDAQPDSPDAPPKSWNL